MKLIDIILNQKMKLSGYIYVSVMSFCHKKGRIKCGFIPSNALASGVATLKKSKMGR